MDPSYKLRDFLIEISKSYDKIKEIEEHKKHKKLTLLFEVEKDLLRLKETAKKMLLEKKLTEKSYDKITEKTKNMHLQVKKIKKELTNPLP